MIDRFGNLLNVGWTNHQILWIEAALTLPSKVRGEAYRDIATMTSRNEAAVRQRAARVVKARRMVAEVYTRERLFAIAKQLREERV